MRPADPIVVQIGGTRVACSTGLKDSWPELAAWAPRQLSLRIGDRVRVKYFDLFDPARAPFPVALGCRSDGSRRGAEQRRQTSNASYSSPARGARRRACRTVKGRSAERACSTLL